MKKGWIIALGLLLIGCLGAYIWYNKVKQQTPDNGNPLLPRFTMRQMNISDIGPDAMTVTVSTGIANPLPVTFRARELAYRVFIANREVVADAWKKPITVKANDSVQLTLPVRVLYKRLEDVLKTLDKKDIDSTDYRMEATFQTDVPIAGNKFVKIVVNRKLPTFYIPEAKVQDIDLGKLGLKRTDVAVTMRVVNKNKFPFYMSHSHYSVTIAGKLLADGEQASPILIRKQDITVYKLPITIKPGNTLSILPKYLFDKKDTPFQIDFSGHTSMKEHPSADDISRVKTIIKGTLDDLKKLKNK